MRPPRAVLAAGRVLALLLLTASSSQNPTSTLRPLLIPTSTLRPPLIVLHGSQTGIAEEVAHRVADAAYRRGFLPRCMSMDAYPLILLTSETTMLCVASTTGDGEAPLSMRSFWTALRRRDLPHDSLTGLSFAVFGCGDSGYPKFNAIARRLDSRLSDPSRSRFRPWQPLLPSARI